MPDVAVLITGAAGYIGSHAVLAFREAGHRVIALDDLSTGARSAVPADVVFVEGDAGNGHSIGGLIRDHGIEAVIHFAGSIIVPESVFDPLKYYRNNACVSRNLIQTCIDNGVRRFIFSSTAAVYGFPEIVPVPENSATQPINPYGTSKLITEWMLRDAAAAHDFSYVALRYFNVAGADPQGRAGQSTRDATHLIKVACETVTQKRSELMVFGDDYDTADGTCIRDYIHVTDLVAAHVRALQHLIDGGDSDVLNCGYGHGYSVKQVIDVMRTVAGRTLPVRIGPRRPGDAPELVADASRLHSLLDWRPEYDDLSQIIASALAWERKLQGQ